MSRLFSVLAFNMHFISRLPAYLWPLPYTLGGITVGLLLAGRFRQVDGVVEIHGPLIADVLGRFTIPAMAITIGHVVFGQSEVALSITRQHERVHVRQYQRWGPAFVPAYLGASVVMYFRGRDPYRDNPFEVEAYAIDPLVTSRHA
jgi:hypothetical protein